VEEQSELEVQCFYKAVEFLVARDLITGCSQQFVGNGRKWGCLAKGALAVNRATCKDLRESGAEGCAANDLCKWQPPSFRVTWKPKVLVRQLLTSDTGRSLVTNNYSYEVSRVDSTEDPAEEKAGATRGFMGNLIGFLIATAIISS